MNHFDHSMKYHAHMQFKVDEAWPHHASRIGIISAIDFSQWTIELRFDGEEIPALFSRERVWLINHDSCGAPGCNAKDESVAPSVPIPMILCCPACGLQHVDVDDESGKWATTRHHKKHLCKPEDGGCGHVWLAANVFTVGVAELVEVPI